MLFNKHSQEEMINQLPLAWQVILFCADPSVYLYPILPVRFVDNEYVVGFGFDPDTNSCN